MEKNTGEPYEILAQHIFNQILNEGSNININVRHNVSLPGKEATHQIDIYWEFKIGDIIYSTIVEVKDWSSTVDQGKLFQFKCILNDLPGQPKGIFVTHTGYQEGAREYAKKNGILLYELREPTEQDWNDRIKTFDVNLSLYTPHFSNIKFDYDVDWNLQEFKRLNFPLSEASKIHIEISDNLKFYDENDVELNTAMNLINSLVPKGFDELPPAIESYTFDKPTFIKTLNLQVPRVKIKAIEVTISKTLTTKNFQYKGEDFVGYVLRNVTNGTAKTFPKMDKECE